MKTTTLTRVPTAALGLAGAFAFIILVVVSILPH
jgi:hypothetical protein